MKLERFSLIETFKFFGYDFALSLMSLVLERTKLSLGLTFPTMIDLGINTINLLMKVGSLFHACYQKNIKEQKMWSFKTRLLISIDRTRVQWVLSFFISLVICDI